MFGRNAGTQKRAAALSLRGDCACYAELERADETWRLTNAQKIELPSGCLSGGHIVDGARLGAFLRAKLRFCWKKLPLAVGIPTADCVFQLICLPAADVDEAREALRWKFERYFPFSYEEALFDVCEVRLPSLKPSEIGVMAAAASRKELEPLFDALKDHSSRVYAAEPLAVACARSLLPPSEDGGSKSLFLAAFLDDAAQLCFVRDGMGLLFRGFCLKDATLVSVEALQDCAAELRKTLDSVKTR
ncbi:MAG: pilus assembly protein PilM, partial [Pyramidobacter sp.]|nr:pilus assembly protein PilM [Pyramidobacter sp.]